MYGLFFMLVITTKHCGVNGNKYTTHKNNVTKRVLRVIYKANL